MSVNDVQLLLADVAVIIILARLLGIAARRLGQPPVLGEILAGILLGPTFFHGRITTTLFPPALIPPLTALADIGLVLFMFVVGYEVDLRLIPDENPRRGRLGGGGGARSDTDPPATRVAHPSRAPRCRCRGGQARPSRPRRAERASLTVAGLLRLRGRRTRHRDPAVGSDGPRPSVQSTCWPTSTRPAPLTDPPKRSTVGTSTSADPPSASATSPTTSPDPYSKPAASDLSYTLECDEPVTGSRLCLGYSRKISADLAPALAGSHGCMYRTGTVILHVVAAA
jgi:Sodium/hydrogen exchanger family